MRSARSFKPFLIAAFLIFAAASAGANTCDDLLRKYRETFDPESFYWNFPSDHLPVLGRIAVNQTGERLAWLTWNVLNSNFKHHLQKDDQGLRDSAIIRRTDRHEWIMEILNDHVDRSGLSGLALQEVDEILLNWLEGWTKHRGWHMRTAANPKHWRGGRALDHGVVIFDPARLTEIKDFEKTTTFLGYKNYIQQLGFRTARGATFLFANVHRPHDDHSILIEYINRVRSHPIVIAGDLNFNLDGTREFLRGAPEVGLMRKSTDDFSHVNTRRELSDYDHFLFSGKIDVTSDGDLGVDAKAHLSLER